MQRLTVSSEPGSKNIGVYMCKTFLMCVGAPKSGTTWLYQYLKSFDNVNLGFKKEYHVFDVRHVPCCEFFESAAPLNNKNLSVFEHKQNRNSEILSSIRKDPHRYFEYFASLLESNQGVEVTLTGDFTPTYMLLNVSVFNSIRESFEVRNIKVKAVFLMRDPLERLISLARMTKRVGFMGGQYFDRNEPLEEILEKLTAMEIVRRTSEYTRCISTLQGSFHRNSLFITTYDKLFRPDGFAALNEFLGTERKNEWLQKKINSNNAICEDHRVSISSIAECLRASLLQEYETFNSF